MKTKFKIFEAGKFTSWGDMCNEVAMFVNKVGQDDLITISHSVSDGKAVIIVWYWVKKTITPKSKKKSIRIKL
jgi:hypothetical protein